MNGRRQIVAALAARTWSGRCGAALLLACGVAPGAVRAQTPAPVAPDAVKPNAASKAEAAEATEDAQDEILVTAHRQRGALKTDVPPEVSISSTAIRALGAADLDEVFELIAPEIRSGQSAPGQTTTNPVVLVNGQRIAGFDSIKDFPPEAVLHIEVFPEQVALQYGYGPDQRVVNIVLRSQYRAFTLLGRYTLAPDNWRGVYRAKADLIRIGETSHWNVGLDYSHQDPILDRTTLAGPPDVATSGAQVPAHTLATQNDSLTISGASTSNIGAVTAELTGRLALSTLQSRPGLSDADGDLLAAEGLANLESGPLDRVDKTVDAQTNLTLNGRLDSNWRWSVIGRLDETTRITHTDVASGNNTLVPVLLPSPGEIGDRCVSGDPTCVSTTLRTASGDAYLNGDLLALPAGSVIAALRTGFVFSGIRSNSSLDPHYEDRNRTEGNIQGNLDVPLTSRDSPIGKLNLGANGEVRHLSDFGTLTTVGGTLNWSPIGPVTILGSFSHEQQAPGLDQLYRAGLDTPDLREFDFVQGNTAIVDRIEGGTVDLRRATARTGNLRLQVAPLRTSNLTLSADYTIVRTRNPIASLTAATDATMAAFPDRFTRSAAGYLTAIDVTPVNLDRRDQQQIRWGINWSTPFGSARPVPGLNNVSKPPVRNQFQIALYDTWRLQDDVVLRDGQPRLDLLGHDFISDLGGTPAHEIELQTTLSTGAWSADVNAEWQTHTTTFAGPEMDDKLTFSQGVRFNLRLTLNLSAQRWLTARVPWLRGNLNISADNLLGAHTRVHDANGGVPSAYQGSYLNPTGQTFRITLRKRFR